MILEKKKEFNYCTLLGELMYAYITCCPDIGYAVTKLSKFSLAPTEYHYYTLLRGVAIYLQNTIEWGIWFQHTRKLQHPDFQSSTWYIIPIKPLNDQIFDVNINCPVLTGFVDAAHANELQKQQSTTGLVFTFCDGTIVYKCKTHSLTAGSLTEAKFIAAVSATKAAQYI